jgi:Ca2+-binding RTX toxin-like protein
MFVAPSPKGASRSRDGERRAGFLVAVGVLCAVALAGAAAVVALPLGGSGGKTITGTAGPDVLIGTPGNDVISGLGGNDRIEGRGGDDVLDGGAGYDTIKGEDGNDRLLAAADGGSLNGGGGRDEFNMQDGEQLPAPGPDAIDARDSALDAINCGAGADAATVDRAEDGVYDCETVSEPSPGQ